jgi:hypothetical protein
MHILNEKCFVKTTRYASTWVSRHNEIQIISSFPVHPTQKSLKSDAVERPLAIAVRRGATTVAAETNFLNLADLKRPLYSKGGLIR